MELTHSDLIELARILGYDSSGGICLGFSVMLGQAILAEETEIFFARLRFIKTYKGKFHELKKDIEQVKEKLQEQEGDLDEITEKSQSKKELEEIKKKVRNKKLDLLNEEEKKLLEIPAFFDGILLSLNPSKFRDIFNGKNVTPLQFREIYPAINSVRLENLENKGAPNLIIFNQNYAFNHSELTAYLTDLEAHLRNSTSVTPIFLTSTTHSVLLHYDKKENKWMYIDINSLEKENKWMYIDINSLEKENKRMCIDINSLKKENYYIEDNKELAKNIFISFPDNGFNYVIFNITAVSNSSTIKDRFLFKSLHLNHFTEGQHLRYGANEVGLLRFSCQHGHLNKVRELLKHSEIEINKADNKGITSLYAACINGHWDIVEELLKHPEVDINKADNIETTPLYAACGKGHLEVVIKLLTHSKIEINKADNIGITPLYAACYNGHLGIVKELLKRPEIQINQANNECATPLYIACQNGHLEIVKELLKHPEIDINNTDNKGITPLYVACHDGNLDIVKELLKYPEIEINQGKNTGANALYIACQNGHLNIVRELLKNKKININEYLNTALCIASHAGHVSVVRELLMCPEKKIDLKGIEESVQHISEPKKAIISLYLHIKEMESYGNYYGIMIANELRQKIDDFYNLSLIKKPSMEDINYFASLFNANLMNNYGEQWKPTFNNIIFSLARALAPQQLTSSNKCSTFIQTDNKNKRRRISTTCAPDDAMIGDSADIPNTGFGG